MKTFAFGFYATLALVSVAHADPSARAKYQPIMDQLARKHDVPERLIHRIIMRESKYAPHLVSKGNYGMMQIKPATARGMGYAGAPSGLLDGKTNLTYAVPYLANAYHIAGRNEDAAVRLYAGGYYYVAKRKGMLAQLQTAHRARGAATEVAKADESKTQIVAAAEPVEAETVADSEVKTAVEAKAEPRTAKKDKRGKTRALASAKTQPAPSQDPQAAAYAPQPQAEADNPISALFGGAAADTVGADPAR